METNGLEEIQREYTVLLNRNKSNLCTGKELARMKKLEDVLKDETEEDPLVEDSSYEYAKREAAKLLGTEGVFVPSDAEENNKIQYIPISKIMYPEFKDRSGIDKEKIKGLSKSIERVGLIQPIVLLKQADGTYLKISGRRRIEATKLLGKKKIKADVRDGLSDEEVAIMIAHENMEREDLSIYDKARQFLFFMDFYFDGLSDEQKVSLIKKSDNLKKGNVKETEEGKKNLDLLEKAIDIFGMGSLSSLSRKLGVLKMPKEVIEYINNNEISYKVAVEVSRHENKVFKSDSSYSGYIAEVVERQCSAKEAKDLLLSFVNLDTSSKKGENVVERVSQKMGEVRKMMKGLSNRELEAIEKNIDKIMAKFAS